MAEPTTVPTASANSASFILGIFPSLSSIPARLAVPTRVPMVSNISIIQKVTTNVITVNQPTWAKPLKLNLNRVVSAISAKGGTKDASVRDAKGFVCRKTACPAQLTTLAASMPRMTHALTPFCANMIMTKRPINIVTTVSTI